METPPREDMVAWYDPMQLLRTGLQTVLTEVFARRADFRLIMALGEPQATATFDDRDALWIDYVADTGDGWRPTTAVLYALARPALTVGDERLPRGELLVMGGDQVYPTGGVEAYASRLLAPMRAVSVGATGEVALLAIPGNHDWYDGLTGFVNTFAQRDTHGLWRTFQRRSYHCLRLPHRHWLLAVDLQLQCDLDVPQRRWFEQALAELAEGDHVILCLAEPTWVFRQQYRRDHGPQLEALRRFVTETKRARVVLWLAGDLHHYRRMERTDAEATPGAQYVTAGGGGAFLHPTHTPSAARLHRGRRGETRRFTVHAEYPPRAVSLALSSQNLLFPIRNARFGFATAVIYTLFSWLLPQARPEDLAHGVGPTIVLGLERAVRQPSAIALVVLFLVAVVYFTDSNRLSYRVGAGVVHGLAHLLAALVATSAGLLAVRHLGLESPFASWLLVLVATLALGYMLGAVVMGAYLFVSVRVFRRHGNEAFSSLRLEGFKNFVRMRIDARGISLWALGLERMPGRWSEASWPLPVDDDPAANPRVIDALVIPGPAVVAAKTTPR